MHIQSLLINLSHLRASQLFQMVQRMQQLLLYMLLITIFELVLNELLHELLPLLVPIPHNILFFKGHNANISILHSYNFLVCFEVGASKVLFDHHLLCDDLSFFDTEALGAPDEHGAFLVAFLLYGFS